MKYGVQYCNLEHVCRMLHMEYLMLGFHFVTRQRYVASDTIAEKVWLSLGRCGTQYQGHGMA